ncbi:recombinase family protein [Lysinibacillus yapensis]|nr:recombinase family protein [Lysinibacillus yapensis]
MPRKVKMAALYLRRSRQDIKFEKLTGEDTLKAQRVLMGNFLSTQDFPCHPLPFEEIISASSIEKREQFKKILKGIEDGTFDAIVCKDVSRLSRGLKDSGYIHDLFKDYETIIITPGKIYDCSNDEDLKMLRMELFLFQEEWQIIRKRMVGGRRLAAERGFYIGGPVPFGFQVDDKTRKLVPHEEESKTVKDIYNLYVNEGWGLERIANYLNHNGTPSPKGKKWLKHQIRRVLSQEKNIGIQVFGRTKLKGKAIKPQPEETWIQVEEKDSAILISEEEIELFKKAQELLADNRVNYDTQTHKRVYALSKLITCGVCGKNMMRKNVQAQHILLDGTKKKYITYHMFCPDCKGGIKYDRIEERLLEILNEYVQIDAEKLEEKLLTELSPQENKIDAETEIASYKKRIEKLKDKRNRNYNAYLDGAAEEEDYNRTRNEINIEIQDLGERIEIIKKTMSSNEEEEQAKVNVEKFLVNATEALRIYESLADPFKNELLHKIFDEVKLFITKKTRGKESEFHLEVKINSTIL